jgi:hypothetical protein
MLVACGGTGASHATAGSGGGRSGTTAGASGGSAPTSAGAGASGQGGSASASTSASSASSGSGGGGTTLPMAGNPYGSCKTLSLPAEAKAVDTSKPTTVVGTGTASSCTFAALAAAVTKGGIVTFDCGPDVVTIPITATLTPPISTGSQAPLDIVIDGGNKITLDGGGSTRILSWLHATWRMSKDTLTLQHIQLINGKTTPTKAIPACPPSGGISNTMCSTGFDDGEGGAIHMQDGSLRVIDCTFANNDAALLGPDTGGGAIYLFGTGVPSYIAGSTFKNNKAANAGAVGMLWAGAFIFDSLFDGNAAVGTGANNSDPKQCTCMNNGQNQIGSGGNGGAIYKDGGDGVALTICGSQIQNNTSNEFGPAVFLTADGSGAQLVIDDTVMKNNVSQNPVWQWCKGVSTDNTSSPAPIGSTFCDSSGSCSTTCP